MFFTDPRDYQILFLGSFLFLGIVNRDWTLHPETVITLLLTCWITQIIAVYLKAQILDRNICLEDKRINWRSRSVLLCNVSHLSSLRSATITGLGLSLLLRADNITTVILAGSLAIASKFLFEWRGKHFFNPANFGIIATVILTRDAWVSPGQWGDEWWYALLFVGTGGIVLKKVGRWDTTAAFLVSYGALEAIRNVWLGWTWDVYFHRLTSGSLLLFALFMITDPRSIPDAKASRLIWSLAIAIVTFILRNFFFIHSAVFWALFIVSPATILLDWLWQEKRFIWQKHSAIADSEVLI
jgi:Na+-transporting NADH:ubiquinone oxidoreductase subunit NqrB